MESFGITGSIFVLKEWTDSRVQVTNITSNRYNHTRKDLTSF